MMPDSPREIPLQAEGTDVRFGMKSLLIAMVIIAIAATCLGWFLRRLPSDVHVLSKDGDETT